jgi:prepilin-type N-terminal cleavage/methylation domain-containing protein
MRTPSATQSLFTFASDCLMRSQKDAFTLLELLVVIAIIAILAALLLPVLSRGKNQAAKATDLNNLRQIIIALNIYAADNHDGLAWPNWDYGGAMPDGTGRPGWLYTPDLSASGPAVFQAQTGLLWNSLKEPKSFLCPMDQPFVPGRAQQLSSYIMNGAVIGFRSGYYSNVTPVRISEMLPGDCVLFEANEQDPSNFNDGSSWPSEGISARHLQGATLAAIDGSSSYVRDDEWQNEVYCTNKNRLWCYPNTSNGGDPVYGHVILNK